MIQFRVSGMTCGNCAAKVTQAIKARYPNAKVDIDLKAGLVTVGNAEHATDEISMLIENAGYPVIEENRV